MPRFIVYVPFLNVAGMALFPFILIKERHYRFDKQLINHEYIHLVQQVELLILPFYVFYVLNYLFNLLKYKNHHEAYMNICFEREAYYYEDDLNYPKKRKLWGFWRFIRSAQ